jgi:adenine-specific DNA-methyltransferase
MSAQTGLTIKPFDLYANHEDQTTLLETVDFFRLDACRKLDENHRSEMGQFLTPLTLARFMASMFKVQRPSLHLLDAGAGVGSLSAAWIAEVCSWKKRPREVSITAYEIDPVLAEYLKSTLETCHEVCRQVGIKFIGEVLQEDFIEAGGAILKGGLFAPSRKEFNCAILNPPYGKIHSRSEMRWLLRNIGIETSNLYTAFLWVVSQLLDPGGELVAITPRSFCNGPYFKAFRESFLEIMTLRRVHVFESRDHAFQEDQVLQENVILRAVKETKKTAKVLITSSRGPEDEYITTQKVEYNQLVQPDDPDSFIHIIPDELGRQVVQQIDRFKASLFDLGLSVSTGRVVDFRAKDFLRANPQRNTAPLIYPGHFLDGFVKWPKEKSKKPNALVVAPETDDLLVPAGTYVLVKRFSAKEERRRIVAAIYDPARASASRVGFENHLNYYHSDGKGLPTNLAKGLAIFLNSTLVDSYFRQFSGHTQVNATDLRSLKYPARAELEAIGARIGDVFPRQDELDHIIREELLHMPEEANIPDPILVKKKIDETITILKHLGLPREQQNDRSALSLLALLDLKPDTDWSEANNPLRGITPMMGFFAQYYGKTYAPNTRETVRRFSVHQFMDAGLVIANPDKPSRPVNSPKAVYQIEENALELLRTYGTREWDKNLKTYLTSIETLQRRYARERDMDRIPVNIASGQTISLSPGGQNVLVKTIIDEFCPRFTPGGQLIYVGDTDEKWAYFDSEALKALGVSIEAHGKIPDVVVYHTAKGWLVLIEAVTSHGPVNPKRRNELKILFKDSMVGLVFVTAFLTRRAMVKYLNDISWETEVWVAESPTHMIHFNGERFLGPY